jgi:HAD superfamily hydrolase (TIGR01484 family)
MKKLIVFDLDGTLAESKSPLDGEMAGLLGELIGIVKVAVISGGDWLQFETQVLSHLPRTTQLTNLSILPTCGTKFYRYSGGWTKIYSEDLTAAEKTKIVASLNTSIAESGVKVDKLWGEAIEDRGSQITYSALGQHAPLDQKTKWDPDYAKRKKIKALAHRLIPEFSVRMGGATSIDVTKPGIDKAYGIGKLKDVLGISILEMMYIGDALFPGGNDYPAEQAGVVSVCVRAPHETKRVVETAIGCLT